MRKGLFFVLFPASGRALSFSQARGMYHEEENKINNPTRCVWPTGVHQSVASIRFQVRTIIH
jgi:hypothetical protein